MADATTEGAESPAEKPKYDQAFFLDLAAKGKDEWNKWRRNPANKGIHVTFAGIDFSEEPRDQIGFSGFEFGDDTDFSGCRWQNFAIFDEANFGHGTSFRGAVFHRRAYFRATTFGHFADFSKATFDNLATFDGATFGNGELFGSGSFAGESAIFTRAIFSDVASFCGATFNPCAIFDGVIFRATVDFSGLPDDLFTEKLERCLGPTDYKTARKELEERHRNSWKQHECRPDRFLTISFANARFGVDADLKGAAIFSGRSFEDIANFTGARFCFPPDFDSARHLDRIDFTGAYVGFAPPGNFIHWTKESDVPLRLRAFRKVVEETKNHDLERDLYIEERKAERGVYLRQRWEDLKREGWKNWPRNARRLIAHCLWIIVMWVYWALADYGRSLLRPSLAWAALTFIAFPWLYDQILLPPPKTADEGKYEQALQSVARANAVPFVGSLTIDADIKNVLFCEKEKSNNCHPIPSKYYQWAVVGQNLLSIILVFFIGLALRNYFKIK